MIIALSKPVLSRNKLDSMHWAKRGRERKSWEWEIKRALIGKIARNKAEGKRLVKITILRPRRYDPDNAVGGCKPVIDALKNLGLIKNDSPVWMEFKCEQKIQHEGTGTIIEVTEV